MFTGIIEATGKIVEFTERKKSRRLLVKVPLNYSRAAIGSSIAVNGVCLTVVVRKANQITFDVLEETCRRTNLANLIKGDQVNLEQSLRVNDRFGGHFVTGHIDGVGKVKRFEREGNDFALEIQIKPSITKYLIEKGSIAIDGISLTVASVKKTSFLVWIIPHTRQVTNLTRLRMGDSVNIEVDMIGKYVEKFLKTSRQSC